MDTVENLLKKREETMNVNTFQLAEFYAETASAFRHVVKRDRPLLMDADSPDQGQPQSKPFSTGLSASRKRLKYLLFFVFWNSDTAVFNPKSSVFKDEPYPAAIRVMQRVAQQIAHDGTQKYGVIARRVAFFFNDFQSQSFGADGT